eukprot:TRINITY_DN8362_c0_g1_i2.p1 TRINITY_DN8362_c0_g1~~TRINITY_DN8362_c0_g1_i2.p1  ORF type:complete len:732 (+),score=224.18 TRINITY_DN8362_c0_g1_i2:87-2198(+)
MADGSTGARWSHCTLDALRHDLECFAAERDWEQFHTPRNLLLALQGEVGELAEIFQWKGEVPAGLPGWSISDREHTGEELSDVLMYTVRMADRCGIDLAAAVQRKIRKNAAKYPAKLCRGSSAKYTEYARREPSPPSSPARSPAPAPAAAPAQRSPAGGQSGSDSHSHSHRGRSGGRTSRGQYLDAQALQRHDAHQAAHHHPPRRPAFKRTLSVLTGPKATAQDPRAVYSPTHFAHGLFSPACAQTDFDIEYNTRTPILPQSISKSKLAAPDAVSPLSPRTMRSDFFPMIEALATSTFTEEEFAALNLTWCVVGSDGAIVDLIPNGRRVPVTLSQQRDFVRRALELRDQLYPDPSPIPSASTAGSGSGAGCARQSPQCRASPLGGQHSPPGGARSLRPGFRRTLSAQNAAARFDPRRVQSQFSPSHFDHDLFSPHTLTAEVTVDTAESIAQQGARTAQAQGNGVSAPAPAAAAAARSPVPAPAAASPSSSPVPSPAAAGSGPRSRTQRGAGRAGGRGQPAAGRISPKSPGQRLTPVHSFSSFSRRKSVASGTSLGDDEGGEYRGLDLLCEVADEMKRERDERQRLQEIDDQLAALSQEDASGSASPDIQDYDSAFYSVIEQLERTCSPDSAAEDRMSAADLRDMHLTFCIQKSGQKHDLIPDGRHVPVTLDRLPEFIRLAKDTWRRLGGTGAPSRADGGAADR